MYLVHHKKRKEQFGPIEADGEEEAIELILLEAGRYWADEGTSAYEAQELYPMGAIQVRGLWTWELKRLASMKGVETFNITCKADVGYGPCGTYLDWTNGYCSEGHELLIIEEDDD